MAYGTDQGLLDWATQNGFAIPAGAVPAVMRQRGSVYLDGTYGDPLAPRTFKGVPTGGYAQANQWPRTGVSVYKQPVPDNVTPVQVEHSAYYAGWLDATTPGSLQSDTSQSGAVKSEQIGDLKTEFFGPGDKSTVMTSSPAPVFSYIEGLLGPFLVGSASAASIGLWSIGPKDSACG